MENELTEETKQLLAVGDEILELFKKNGLDEAKAGMVLVNLTSSLLTIGFDEKTQANEVQELWDSYQVMVRQSFIAGLMGAGVKISFTPPKETMQ